MVLPSYRKVNLLQALGSAATICVAIVYFQYHLGLQPCYLCITQRLFVIAIGIVCAIATVHNPTQTGQRIYAVLSVSMALLGGYFSAKQLWLQSLPEDQVPACGVPVDYLFDAFPASEAITLLLRGDGHCAVVQWQLLGFSMPAWVMLTFIGFAVMGTIQFLRRN